MTIVDIYKNIQKPFFAKISNNDGLLSSANYF